MGIHADRKDLEKDGYKLPPMIAFSVFTELWKRHVNKETAIGIIREFWEDYLTSTCKNYTEYFKQIEN